MDNMIILATLEEILGVISDLIINLLASLIWAIGAFFVVFFYNKILSWYSKRKFKKSTRLAVNRKQGRFSLQCFIANSGKYDGEEKVYLGYPFEYMAAATINAYLYFVIKNVDMGTNPCPLQVNSVAKIDKTTDLVLLGGPFHNILTKMFFGLNKQKSNVPFYFDTFEGEDATLFYKENGATTYKTVKPIKDPIGQYYCEDYALIMNVKNPYNPEKRIISIIGCRSIGVLGGTLAFTTYNKKLLKDIKFDEYAVIIKCYGEQNNINTDRKIELITTIQLNSIDIKDLIEIKDREEVEIK